LSSVGGDSLKTKIINISDWNMDSTISVSVSHGLDVSTIRSISVTIRNDADNLYTPLDYASSSNTVCGKFRSYATLVELHRFTGCAFDDPAYDSTSYNRGWVIITYTA